MTNRFPGSADQLFTRCGHFLCGGGTRWKEQFAAMLMVQTNTVDNWHKGTSRVPPGVWREIAGFIQDRENEAPTLRLSALLESDPEPDPSRGGFQTQVHSGPRRRS
jgi:hypothetical protein